MCVVPFIFYHCALSAHFHLHSKQSGCLGLKSSGKPSSYPSQDHPFLGVCVFVVFQSLQLTINTKQRIQIGDSFCIDRYDHSYNVKVVKHKLISCCRSSKHFQLRITIYLKRLHNTYQPNSFVFAPYSCLFCQRNF